MNQKESAIEFLRMCASGKVEEAYEWFVSPGFKHHNQHFKGDRESLKQAMIEAHEKMPNKHFEVYKVFEDGDTVITYSKVDVKNGHSIAVVHMSRFLAGKIVELWDLGQIIDPASPNENGLF